MTFLEGDQVSLCDLLEQENNLRIVTVSACDEIWARCSGTLQQVVQRKRYNLHFVPPRPAPTLLQEFAIEFIGVGAALGGVGFSPHL